MAKHQNLFEKQHLWVTLLSAACLVQTTEALLVNRDIDLNECYGHVKAANNGNAQGRINENRFFNFLKRLDEDEILASKTSYDDLPFYAKETYEILISVCDFDIWTFTCAAQNAAGFLMPDVPREGITEEPELYLFNICYSAYDTFAHLENSEAPTDVPSSSPSASPTSKPSVSPSQHPSVSPSQSPTMRPSSSPSASPTSKPSVSPSQQPSVSPTASPTASPTVSHRPSIGSEHPTVGPTLSFPPTSAPTRVVTEETSFTFNFALAYADNDNEDGLDDITEYYSLIQVAFGGLINTLPESRRLRSLGVVAGTFYTFSNPSFYDCPAQTTNLLEDPLCLSLDLTGSVKLSGPEAINDATIENAKDSFESNVVTQVEGGRLQNEVQKLDYESSAGLSADDYILVLDGLNGNAGQARVTDTGDSGGSSRNVTTTTSVVAAAMLVLLVPFVLLLFQRTRSRDNEKQKVFYEPYEYDPAEESPSDIETDEADMLQSQALSRGVMASGSQTLGATRANYGLAKPSRRVLEAMEAGDDIVAEPEFDVERDSSSNAGSSGWSSSAGISSYNTGSMDDSMDAAYAAGTTLAAIGGATSSLNKHMRDAGSRMSDSTTTGGSVSPGYNRDQLDSFIEAGDWAAVGATAALLAAASDSQSASTAPSKRSRGSHGAVSLEAQRAAELDHLVDAGDWEGVVLAAARFEAAETTVYSRGSRTASSADSTGSASGASRTAGSGTIESGTVDTPSDSETASHSMSRSDDPSRARQRKEIRSEVEALVRRVVPEEIDNVDEMMNQFKGREEELVETLRTMQERAIAQKARTAGQKTAKMEARKNVQRGVVPGTRPPPPETKPVAMRSPQRDQGQVMRNVPVVPLRKSSVNSGSSQSGTNGSASSHSNYASGDSDSMKETRTALEAAINAGDWEAVGKAAAFLSDNSVATGGTGPDGQRGQSNHSIASGSTRSRGTKDSEMAIRQQELDDMISKGDWSAVVAAANRFSQMDKTVKTEVGRTAEEEDALQQAKMWANIANQTRTEGANDTGASHAAEWAIQRSLHKMNQQKSNSPQRDQDFDEV